MKTQAKLKCVYVVIFGLYRCVSMAHDVPVHQRITENAADSALALSSPYSNFIATVSADISVTDARRFLSQGSAREDDAGKDEGGNRSYNHFYDPLTGLGMSDVPPDQRISANPNFCVGTNSFTWATVSNCLGLNFVSVIGVGSNMGTSNKYSWQNARGNEWLSLTATSHSDRFTYLTNMFRALGQVIHLLEDTSQPQHVRNEQHLYPYTNWLWNNLDPWKSPIETYGATNVNQLNYTHSMLPWREDGFTKLEDFWNRHLYNGDPSKLENAETGGAQLGLAEWCNGNFVGATHLFPEYFNPGSVQYYPFPSRNHSTDYSDIQAHPSHGVGSYTLKGGKVVQGIYLSKNADGVRVTHLTRVNYLGAKIPNLAGPRYCTINDRNVLKDLHDQVIPKAVEYAAGLIDYFFRGSISVSNSWDNDVQMFDLTITNNSGRPLSSGQFHLFSDDESGNRTEVPSDDTDFSQYQNSLDNGAGFEATFTPPTNAVDYTLVYIGTIGTNANGGALDPVDGGITLAATSFKGAAITTKNALQEGQLCLDYSVQLQQVGLDNDLVQWTVLDGALPDGLQLDPDTGIISGAPTTEGQYQFTIQASDGVQDVTNQFDLTTVLGVDSWCSDYGEDVYIHADQASSLMSCSVCSYENGSPTGNFDMDFVYGYGNVPCQWVAFAPGNQIQHDGGGYSANIYGNILGWKTTCGQTYFTMVITCDGIPNSTNEGPAIWSGTSGYQDSPVGVYTKTFDCAGTGPDTITVSAGP